MSTRTQTFLHANGEGRFKSTLFGQYLIEEYVGLAYLRGWQKTVDDDHGFSRDLLGLTDMGGSFFSEKKWASSSTPQSFHLLDGTPGGYLREYRGPLAAFALGRTATDSPFSWPASAEVVSANLMVTAGATAIARTIPTTPTTSVLQILGELREKLPAIPGHLLGNVLRKSIKTTRIVDHAEKKITETVNLKKPSKRDVARSAGGEHLNLQFGVLPTVSEFRKFYWAYKRADRMWAEYVQGAKRLSRRRYAFPTEVSTTTEVLSGAGIYPALPAGVPPSAYLLEPGTLTIETKNSRKLWFSGAYVYAVPEKGFARAETYMSKVYGGRLTPEILWNLAPWSWMVDWFSNTGDVMRNLSELSRDGTLLKWGYVMCETQQDVTYTWKGNIRINNTWTSVSLDQTFHHSMKRRIAASPFGFGLTYSGLTPRQIAIALSVGITH